ncbi:MAG: ABC transporter ATP-binding protein [Nitrososphaerales archaeon]
MVAFQAKDQIKNVGEVLLSVRNLRIYYGREPALIRAVDGVSFDIKRGEITALVGESGSGKTTIALSILSLLPPAAKIVEGDILFKGRSILHLKSREMQRIRGKEIGMVFQEPHSYLNPLIKVGDQVAETLILHENIGKEEARSRVINIFEKVRIADPQRIYHYYPHQLSGGMAQRVGISIAIACNPSLLVADEPTSNLDLTVQSQILHLLKNLSKELGLSVLLITHDLGVVSGLADRVVIIYAGKVAEEADVYSIYTNPQHPYTEVLLASSRVAKIKSNIEASGFLPDLRNPPAGCRFSTRCPYVMEKCSSEPPEVRGPNNSRVYCWLRGG